MQAPDRQASSAPVSSESRDLVRESLRMRPFRIFVEEVRSDECLELLLALNAGLPNCSSAVFVGGPRG